MNYTILVITNEPKIADMYFEKNIYSQKNILLDVLEPIPIGDAPTYEISTKYLAIWEDHYNDIGSNISYKFNNSIEDIDNGFKYRLIKIPFEGLAYLVLRDRKIKAYNNRYIILYIKERTNSRLDTLCLYDFKIDGRFDISLDMINEYCNKYVEHNILMADIFNPVVDLVNKNNIPHISTEYINFLK